MIDFYIKKGDSLPALRLVLQDSAGTVIDLTVATVAFNYQLRYPVGAVTNRTATVYDEDNGIVEYYWATEDVATPGIYNGEFIVTFDDGSEMTFPVRGPFVFEILEDIS